MGSKGKLINWQEHGVEVTVPPGETRHGYINLRVHDSLNKTSFEYPSEYTPHTNVYEINVSSREGYPPQGVSLVFSSFRRHSNLCLLAATRNPSKWTPSLAPVFEFFKMEGMDASLATGRVEVTLKTSGVYFFVAGMYIHYMHACTNWS